MSADDDEPAPERCAIPECREAVARHLSLTEARRAFPELEERGRRAPLCRTHYKQWKKATKDARTLDRLGR
jgi:hypothetical protein